MRISDWSSDVCSSDLIGAHILSGAVVDPKALDELIPHWRELDSPMTVPVTENHHWVLTAKKKFGMPHISMPPFMNNKGCYTVSLGSLCRWRSAEHTSELQSLMRISYAVFCQKNKQTT